MKQPTSEVSVYLGIPHMGEIETELSIRWLQWTSNRNYRLSIWAPGFIRPIPVARNSIVKEFLKTNSTWLLMVDSDVVPSKNILDLTGFGKDVISPLIFTMKDSDFIPLALKETEDGYEPLRKIEMNSLIEVDAIGCGCMLIHRRVFSHIKSPYFKYVMTPDGFLLDGEDFDFCKRVKGKKLKIYLHSGYTAKHFRKVDLTGIALRCQQQI